MIMAVAFDRGTPVAKLDPLNLSDRAMIAPS